MFSPNMPRVVALLLVTSLATSAPAAAQDSAWISGVRSPAQQEAIAACYQQHKGTLYLYAGLNLTPAQIRNYDILLESVGSRIGKINEKGIEKQDPASGLSMYIRDETRSNATTKSVLAAIDAPALENLSVAEKIRLLTASHGKYAVFEFGRYLEFTEAQIKASNVLGQEWESRMQDMMTPTQAIKFRSNIASVRSYEACEKGRPSTYSIQWFMGNTGDEGPKF
jgi:hypothetical protein